MKQVYAALLLFSFSLLCASAPKAQTREWVACYNDTTAYYYPTDIAVDSVGNSYITGYYQIPTDYYLLKHFFVLKNNSAGAMEWINYFPYKDSFSTGSAVAADNLGNVYVTGQRYDTACNICTIQIPFSYAFTIKYNAAGKIVWGNAYNGANQTNQLPVEITVTDNKPVYIVIKETKYNSATGSEDQWLVTQRINPNGKTAWTKTIRESSPRAVTTDKAGNVIVTGSYAPGNIYQLSNILTAKYNANGDSIWQQKFVEYQKNGTGFFIKTDEAGNVYVNGQTDTLTFYNVQRIVTLKYSKTGSLLWWQKEEPKTSTYPNIAGGYTIDKAGNSYIAGYNSTNYPNEDWVVIKRNAAGNLLWSKTYNDSINGSDKPSGGVVVDKLGNVTVAGYSSFFRNTPFTTIQYDAAGNQKWLAYYKPSARSYSYPYGIGLDKTNNIYVGGQASGMCVVKYKGATSLIANELASTAFQPVKALTPGHLALYPNPAHDYILIQTQNIVPGSYQYTISSITGAVLSSSVVSASNGQQTFKVDIHALRAGTYVLKLQGKAQVYMAQFQKQ